MNSLTTKTEKKAERQFELHKQFNLPDVMPEENGKDFVSSGNVTRTDKTFNVKDRFIANDNETITRMGQTVNRTSFSTLVSGSTYTALTSDYIISVTSLSYAPTIGLPRPKDAGFGKAYIIKDEVGGASTSTITVRSIGEETIDGATTQTITTDYGAKGFYSDGANWYLLWKDASGGGLGYTLIVGHTAGSNPADGQTYYIGNGDTDAAWTDTTAARHRIYVPKEGTITACSLSVHAGTAGSAEDVAVYIVLNNTSDTTVTTTSKWNSADFSISATGLSTAVVAGDYLEVKIVTPSWATNPLAVRISGHIYIE